MGPLQLQKDTRVPEERLQLIPRMYYGRLLQSVCHTSICITGERPPDVGCVRA